MVIFWCCTVTILSLCRVFAAFLITAVDIGRANSFAADLTEARISASQILTLIRREPLIDSYSEDGLKLVSRVM